MSDIDRGRQGMAYFHNRDVGRGNYNESLDSLINTVSEGKADIFLDAFGGAISAIDMNDAQVRGAMESLADVTGGNIPRKELFYQALSNRISNPTVGDYIQAAPQITLGMATDVVSGLQQVGNSVENLGGGLLTYGPIILIGALALLAYNFAENPGKIIKGFAV